MKTKKKIIYGLGAISAIALPTSIIISCGEDLGKEVSKGDYSAAYWNKSSKTITFKMMLTDDTDVNKVKPIFKKANVEISDSLAPITKIINEDKVDISDITSNFIIESRGNSGEATKKGQPDFANEFVIDVLIICGWTSDDAKTITS